MPFDVTGINTDPVDRPVIFLETKGSEWVPDVHHIAPDLVLLADGSLLAMVRAASYPFQLVTMRERNVNRRQHNDLFRGIADNNVTLGIHLIHHDHVETVQLGRFRSKVGRRIIEAYAQNCLDGKLVANDWFISIVVSPRFSPARRVKREIYRWTGRSRAEASDAVVRQMKSIMQSLMAYFGQSGGRRLGYRRDANGFLCSEIAEARQLILTGRWRPIPLTTGLLGASIYTERVTCGTRLIQIDHVDGPRFAKTIVPRDYPIETRTGQLSHLVQPMNERFAFSLNQTFHCQAREESKLRLYLKRIKLENSYSLEKRGIEGLKAATEDVSSGEAVRGHHNFGLTVFGETPDAVHRAASAASSALTKAGMVPIMEDGGSFAAFWSQLPGNPEWIEGRSGSISSRNLTAFATLEGFPEGEATGHWGRSPFRFMTTGGTALSWIPHVEEVGHTGFIGGTGRGKTALMGLLVAALEQCLSGGRGTVVWFDKDRGAEPLIRSTGGSYLLLKAGEPSGLNPLKGLQNTPGDVAFLIDWIAKLIQFDGLGPLKTKTHELLRRAVTRQMRLPASERSFGSVRAFLGFGPDNDGERLDRWCWGGALGWMFDGPTDDISLTSPLVGFDMTALLEHEACPMVGAYLIQRINSLIDGRRILVVCDEARFYLLSDLFATLIENFALTLRKKNGMLWLACQEAHHLTASKVGRSLGSSQLQTIFAFPSSDAKRGEFIGNLGFTEPMYRALTETMPTLPYRSVLMKREHGSAILNIGLTGMEDELAILSGRKEYGPLIDEILAAGITEGEAFADAYVHAVRAFKERELAQ